MKELIHGVDVSKMLPEPATPFEGLPELEGTEKQIKWADDIRFTVLEEVLYKIDKYDTLDEIFSREKMIDSLKNNPLINFANECRLDKIQDACEYITRKAVRYNRFKELAAVTSAKFWIENNPYNSLKNYLNKRLLAYVLEGEGTI